jgi:hypothetical protein
VIRSGIVLQLPIEAFVASPSATMVRRGVPQKTASLDFTLGYTGQRPDAYC